MHMGEGWRLGHRPALDGIRGVAIGLVLVGHGWRGDDMRAASKIGVVVFFVLSGYLITSLLASEHSRTGAVDLRAFFVRRVRRLMPAQVTMLALCTTLGLLVGPNFLTVEGAMWAWAYLANVHPDGILSPLWSLATEEQFYLLWAPTLAVLLARRVPLRGLVVGLAGVAVVSAVVRFFDYSHMLYANADGLLAGCALALVLRGRSLPWRGGQWLLVVLAALAFTDYTQARTIWGPVAVVVTCVVIGSAGAATSGLLTWGWLTWLGRRSYGLYLWHWPVFFLADALQLDANPILFVVVCVPIALGLTVLSWRLVEAPFQRRGSVGRVEAPGLLGRGRREDAPGPEPATI